MSWFVSSANEAAAGAQHGCLFIAVELDFQSTTLRCWSGFGTLRFGGNDYLGVGYLGKVSVTPENTRLVAERKTYELSGVDMSLVLQSDLESCFGRDLTEYTGFLDENGQLIDTPESSWEGTMDKPRRVVGVNPFIEIGAEHRLALIEQADGWRYTHEHQQQFFPGDNGLREVPSIETAQIYWGGTLVLPGNGGRPRQTRRN